ncbi:MAG: response regulator [Gemmatimonadetes bacterium]|nr:response regulator [Gemmatimonadota bacterium]
MAHVLVIDDDEDHRTLAREILERDGHMVEVAVDGNDGLRRFGRKRPDVVLTDIHMPGLDGHAVIEALKVLHAEVPIIAVSGGGGRDKDELLLEAMRLGAVEVITKPFDFRQLLGAVQRAVILRR